MGHKLEKILLLSILLLSILPFTIHINSNNRDVVKKNSKESEFSNFVEYEINSTNLQQTLTGKKAVKIDDNWYLKHPNIKTQNIKKLSANRSIVTQKSIEFIDNVEVIKADGVKYKSNRAIYNRKNQDILTPNSFTINRVSDIVKGKKLYYDTKNKITKAKDVNGTFVLKKPKK